MKTGFCGKLALGTVVAMFCVFGGRQSSCAQDQTSPPAAPPDDSIAPSALPPNISPNSPLAGVVKLAQGGVDESVVLSYVNSSAGTFNLNSDQIIYLKDIGLSSQVITAMIQRDQQIGQQLGAAAPPPVQTTAVPEAATQAPPPQPAQVDVNYFYNTLSPYGGWVNVEGYGWCWRPTTVAADAGWQPYCDHGHWVYTDSGWYWMSDYSWGWATFHYGRWFRHPRMGWCWWPDTVWAPSWVSWRYADDYCGWAPLPPFTAWVSGVGLAYRGAHVAVGFDFGLGINAFTFVPTRNFCDPHPRRFRAAPGEMSRIYNRTTIINNFDVDSRHRTIINHGIEPNRITAVTRMEIHPVAIHETSGSVGHGEQIARNGHTLTVDRPHFVENAAPGGTVPANHFRPPVTRPGNNVSQPVIIHGNGNMSPTHDRTSAPNNNNVSPNTWSAPVHTTPQQSLPGYGEDNRRFTSPRIQQTEPSTPHVPVHGSQQSQVIPPTVPPVVHRDLTPSIPVEHAQPHSAPVERPQHDSVPVARPESHASRPDYSGPPSRNAAPPAPAASGSGSPDRSNRRDQGGPGH